MKRFLYTLCLVASLAGLNSCKKDNDPTPDPVAGSWKLDRIRSSGFVAPYASLNADNDPTIFDYQDSFVLKTDKSFTGTVRTSGRVIDYNGNWTYTNNQLTLNDDQGNSETYTFDATKTPAQLLSSTIAQSDTLVNPNTKNKEVVKYNLQFVYTKQ